MNIYSFDRVIELLVSLGANHVYHGHRKHYLERNCHNEYIKMLEATSFLSSPTFTERLYCYANGITTRPKCKVCDDQVRYSSKGKEYYRYCSQKCALSDMVTLIGVQNTSQLQTVKDKKRKRALEKYGVDNVSKSETIKENLRNIRKRYWDVVNKSKEFTNDGLTKIQYRHRCQQYANTQYLRHKHLLDPENKRGKHWHVDHIYSVSDGFINDIPVNIISDITNLRLIQDTQNYKKHRNSEKTRDQLFEDYIAGPNGVR